MFKYDVLIEEEDVCNYEDEVRDLIRYVGKEDKVVLYAPRRYGKTSLLVNVVGKHFVKSVKNALFCHVNLQEVKDLHSISVRFSHSLEEAVSRTFQAKVLFSKAIETLKSLRPQIEVDSITGSPSLSFALAQDKNKGLNDILQAIGELSKKQPMLLVMDEFQDVVFVDEAEALIRNFVQQLYKSSVIISGSKKHILKDIFLDEKKPFYNWGKSVELKPIPFEKWKPYLLYRFKTKKIKLSDEVIRFILESMYYIPNYVCKLCSDIYNSYTDVSISLSDVKEMMHLGYLNSQSRYAEKIAFLTPKQVKLLSVIARNGPVKEITSHHMVVESGLSTRGLSTIYKMLLDKGYLETESAGVRIADPFFAYYLIRAF